VQLWQTIQATLDSLSVTPNTESRAEVAQEVAAEVLSKVDALLTKELIRVYPADNPDEDYIWENAVNAVADVLVDLDCTFNRDHFIQIIKRETQGG
jgi:hypothetical protein